MRGRLLTPGQKKVSFSSLRRVKVHGRRVTSDNLLLQLVAEIVGGKDHFSSQSQGKGKRYSLGTESGDAAILGGGWK